MHRLCVRAALVVVAVLCFAVVSTASEESLTCFSTGRPPAVPYGLYLCYMFAHKACCLPGADLDIKAAYAALIPGGSGCKSGSLRMHAVLYAFLQYLCLPCDPNEPKYRFESAVGDVVSGGTVPPLSASGQGRYTWRVCKSFLYGAAGKKEGIWGDDASQYNTCGINLQSCPATPYYDLTTGTLESPPSDCDASGELVIPSVSFAGATDPALEMLTRVAQTLPDFQFVVVDDTDPNYNYDQVPCFGRSSAAAPLLSTLVAGCSTIVLTLCALWL